MADGRLFAVTLLLFNGLFCRQGVLFLCLSFLQFGLVELGDLSDVWFVGHVDE